MGKAICAVSFFLVNCRKKIDCVTNYLQFCNKMIVPEDRIVELPSEPHVVNYDVPTESMHLLSLVEKNLPNARLLKRLDVIQWLIADTSFLPHQKKNELLDLERSWGLDLLRTIRPNTKAMSNWGEVAEEIARELLMIEGKTVMKPKIMNTYKLDWETAHEMIEVKSQGYHMTGTADEKIFGVPFKYADVPELFNKPVRVILMGGAEVKARNRELLDPIKPSKLRHVAFWTNEGFTFVGGSQILRTLK